MSAASELFAKARAALLVGAPFWGVLSLRLAPVEHRHRVAARVVVR